MNIDAQLRSLDVAAGQPDARGHARKAVLLDRILDEAPASDRSSRPAIGWKIGGVAAAGALIAALAVIVPGIMPTLPAVASWTREAEPVAVADLAIAENACRDQFAGYASEVDGSAPVVLAERRGDIVGLILWKAAPESQGTCIVELARGAASPESVLTAFGGGSGPALRAPAGEFTEGALSQFGAEDGEISLTSGSAGEGIVGLRLHADGLTTEATVDNGRFVAWWPGAAFENTDQPSGKGGPDDIITYDVELADGTVVVDADPWFPSD